MIAYYDLWGALPPHLVPREKRETPRCGDRALLYAYLARWRAAHPEARLVLTEEWGGPRLPQFRRMTRWLAFAVDAEYRLIEKEELPEDLAGAQALTVSNLWNEWAAVKAAGFVPFTPRIVGAARTTARALLVRHGLVRRGYVTVQPLIEVPYNPWRARDVEFWRERIAAMAAVYPVVVVGGPECMTTFGEPPPGAVFAFHAGLDFLESLALIQRAAAHVGGETGLSLWAPLLGTDTIALYDPAGMVYQPHAFSSRLQVLPLDSEVFAPLTVLKGWGHRARWEPV